MNNTKVSQKIEEKMKEFEELWGIGSIGVQIQFGKFLSAKNIEREFVRTALTEIRNATVDEGIEKGIALVGTWFKSPEYKDFNGSCATCGGKPVTIRGQFPTRAMRQTCPTCTHETLEYLFDQCTNRTPSEALSQSRTNLEAMRIKE